MPGAYKAARRFFNIRRDFFHLNDWMAKVNGKRKNLVFMRTPRGEVPQYHGYWSKPHDLAMLRMDEEEKKEHIEKLKMPKPTIE